MEPETLMEKKYWRDYWRSMPLPQRVRLSDYPTRCVDNLLKEHLPVRSDYRFLEVGCGVGKWMIYFHETFGYKVCGTDYLADACECGRRNLALQNIPCQIWEDDLFDTKLTYKTFDVVMSAGFVEHFSDPTKPLAIMAGLLKPGGILITWIPNYTGVYGPLQRLVDKDLFKSHNALLLEDLHYMHEAVGLQVVTSRYLGGFASHAVNTKKLCKRLGLLSFPMQKFQSVLNHSVWLFLRLAGVRWESRWFSPFVFVIARRP